MAIFTVQHVDFESLLERVIQQKVETDVDFCINVAAASNLDAWVEFTWDMLNMSYPQRGEPAVALPAAGVEVPAFLEVTAWDEGAFVTFSHSAEPLDGIAEFLASYLEIVLEVPPAEDEFVLEEKDI